MFIRLTLIDEEDGKQTMLINTDRIEAFVACPEVIAGEQVTRVDFIEKDKEGRNWCRYVTESPKVISELLIQAELYKK